MSAILEISVPAAEKEEILGILKKEGIDPSVLTGRHFDGTDAASIAVVLTPHILAFLAGLYLTRTNAKKHTVYKSKGIEIRGVSEETLLKIIKLEQRKKE